MPRTRLLRLLLAPIIATLLLTAAPQLAHSGAAISRAPLIAQSIPSAGMWKLVSYSLAGFELALTRGLGRAFGMEAAIGRFAAALAQPVLAHVPVDGECQFSSGYGMRRHPTLKRRKMHAGIDFAADPGTPVLAAGSGVVVHAKRMGGYGRLIIIDHGHGLTTRYGHLRRIKVFFDFVRERAVLP